MPKLSKAMFGCVCLTLLLLSCSEDQITNNTVVEAEQGIVGRVLSAPSGTQVAAWQAAEILSTPVDTGGYFALSGLAPGLYEVRITAPGGIEKRIPDVVVRSAVTTSLGTIVMSVFPWPLLSVTPEDGEIGVQPLDGEISILSEEPLDLSSLSTAVLIDPTVAGTWSESQSTWLYTFHPDLNFATATEYTMTILPVLQLESGEMWEDSVEVAFTTDSLRIEYVEWTYYSDHMSLPYGFDGQLVELQYNSYVDPATIEGAISILPPVSFYTTCSDEQRTITVFLESGLVSGTNYALTVMPSLLDSYGHAAAHTDPLAFATRRFAVNSRSYPSTRNDVPPKTSEPLIRYIYSVPLDPASAAAAVSIDPPTANELDISVSSYYEDKELEVSVVGGLTPGQQYTLTISDALSAVDGTTIGSEESIDFEVQPLRVTEFGFGSYYYRDTLVDPGEMGNLGVAFNADVDVDSFNVAAAFLPSIDGVWFGTTSDNYPYYDQQLLVFFPIGPVDLEPEQTYTLTIDGTVGLVGNIGLGTDVQLRFHTYPVRIESIYPSPGSYASEYSDVSFYFNVPMDRVATQAAFSMATLDGTPVSGSFSWYDNDREMTFNPSPYLINGQSYLATVTTAARSESGAYLKEEGQTFFRVQDY